MYYELHQYTSILTNGLVDAKFIAILNTAVESPLAQVAMIPMLAWIAKTLHQNTKLHSLQYSHLLLILPCLLENYLQAI